MARKGRCSAAAGGPGRGGRGARSGTLPAGGSGRLGQACPVAMETDRLSGPGLVRGAVLGGRLARARAAQPAGIRVSALPPPASP